MLGLRTIEQVVRMGHVHRIERDRIVLDDGTIPTSPEHLHVHCAAQGLPRSLPQPIFADDAIRLQCITRMNPTLSAAMTGYVETTDRTTDEKNRLLPPNPYSDTPLDFLRAVLMGLRAELGWGKAADVQAWLDASRLNVLKDVGSTADAEGLRELQGRFLTAVMPAQAKLDQLLASASPAEQELVLEPT